MAKVVFTQKTDSIYDDLPEERYHFPKTYLRQAQSAIGDWVAYYRPRRGARNDLSQPASTYFAVARLVGIDQDPGDSNLFYAIVDQYLEFDAPVSFRRDESSYEVGLLKADGTVNKGMFGRSVRSIDDDAFDAILRAGFSRGAAPWESKDEFEKEQDRPIIERITNEHYRDRRFRMQVREAYSNTCAITGLAFLNGGGRPEVQAAHIRPVADNGPDSIRNGLALSGTAHWMFDRGLLTLDEEMRLVVSDSVDVERMRGLLNPGSKIALPTQGHQHPSQHFLSYHRDYIFHA
jgi:putative restriction endonuclease